MFSPMSLGVAEMNGSNRDMVWAEQELWLIGPEHMIVPLTAEWSYSHEDPYAVTMSLDTGADQPVVWTFARDLLATALLAPAGMGDVQAWPAAESAAAPEDGAPAEDGTGGKVLNIVLGSPDGCARFETDAAAIEAFLGRTFELVPAGQESGHLNLDAGLAELLTQA
jgi:Streptomyces sporulation and cell division protein, SsgA